jgi:hypothetical protein
MLRAGRLRSGVGGGGHTSGHEISPTLHCMLASTSQLFAMPEEKEKDCLD